MNLMRRTLYGYGTHNHRTIAVTPGFPARPCDGHHAPVTGLFTATMSGPSYNGMDPSDPLTYVRPWNPAPGMIAQLNFDGAQMQGRTPTQLQRGSQARRRPLKLRMG